MDLILASGSVIRRQLLQQAGLKVSALPARIDEPAIRAALQAEDASPRDIADTLAEAKARKIATRHSGDLVLGCDQVLNIAGQILNQPLTRDVAAQQLKTLRGRTHQLLSAAVLYENAEPIWRHVGVARLTMHAFSDAYLERYLDRNMDAIATCVGGYQLEAEGVRLFSQLQGDYFTVLGLPLIELLSFLTQRGVIEG